jgi:glycosyltransferase involved in cell wall biosynthesis
VKISFLVMNVTSMGGTVRTTLNLAESLADRHEVEIISVFNTRATPFFEISPRVKVRILDDRFDETRGRGLAGLVRGVASKLPSRYIHRKESARGSFSRWTDFRLRRELRRLDTDVLVSTRASITLAVTRFAPPGLVIVGQEHVPLDAHINGMHDAIGAQFGRLDALVTLTHVDAGAYTELLRGAPTRVVRIANALPGGDRVQSDLSSKSVIAMGRLVPVKRYELLVQAFEIVAQKRPDWTLRIYGSGQREKSIRKVIHQLGLYNQVFLMGRTNHVDTEYAKAAVAVVSSRLEGFGMTIVEAMSHGVPVVSTDCPHGPREIISHGVDGLLVENGDVDALAAGLLQMIDLDYDERRRFGQAAVEKARSFELDVICAQHEQLFAEVVAADRPRR